MSLHIEIELMRILTDFYCCRENIEPENFIGFCAAK